ncbi:flagellar basal-body rod modification protein FlgD [Pseudomonas duriflava]|uniref:Basal-body rod modification protein FlgD n=1 Tax=Pseudomonas duriflava TaxID=459528 RepID=A0A562QA30_9PSED|nr:flagellar hook assembly protein FlgD [Pseudomonas duriflava]TWI53564.1 flagellar basal-body rod modification protein FlgD [Pseudomonas duriflava]
MTPTNSAGVAASTLTSLAGSSSASSAASTEKQSSLGKDDFLKLLVTQLNNQSPLDPQDNSEFVAQLAQFSSVESLQNLNSSVNGIATSYKSAQALQASSLVGRSVIAQTDSALVDSSKSFNGALALPVASNDVSVGVYNSAGSLIKKIELGSQNAGNVDFIWDGTDEQGNKVEPGLHTFKAIGMIDGAPLALSTYLPATVNSVTLGQDGSEMQLNLAGLGSVTLSQVQMIGQ